MDDQVAEGYKAHFIWADEECPRKLFSTLLGRINDMNGRIILSFTTLRGWTDLVSQILRQPKTIQTRFSKLLGRDLPYVQEFDTWGKGVIYYMWSEDNPYINYGYTVSQQRRLTMCFLGLTEL
jgi:phage terminase large subunit-like protein